MEDDLDQINDKTITAKDYAWHWQPWQKQKGITVPKPFNFDIWEKTRPKSIWEWKIEEMIAERELREWNALNKKFKSKNPPPEVLAPKYNSIIEKNEQRRMKVKAQSKEITKKNERPFSFYYWDLEKHQQRLSSEAPLNDELLKPRFKAKEPPPSVTVEMFKQMMTTDKMEREERIRRNAQLSYQKAKLPPWMEMHEKI